MTDTPTVKLGGRDYPVPPIVIRDLKKIFPLLDSVFKAVAAQSFTEQTLDDLARIVYHGTRLGHGLSYEEFLDLPIPVRDQMAALPTVCTQAGLSKDASQGEATAAA